MNIAIIGTGFVADYYMTTLVNHRELTLLGAFDRDNAALARFAGHHRVKAYSSADALLADQDVQLVLNLTTPESHFAVSQAALHAGKHVYSEKPLAMEMGQARALVALAEANGLSLSSAPATVLGEAAEAAWTAIAAGRIGQVRLVYAEMEDGMVFRDGWQGWTSTSGAPWPGRHEFEIGCTLEHAGYYLTWLCAFFGPAREVQAFSTRLFDDKGTGQKPATLAADYSVANIVFANGVVARLTCGLAAARDRSMQIVGDDGSIIIEDGWNSRSPVWLVHPRHEGESLGARLRRVAVERLNRVLPGRLWAGSRLQLRPARLALPAYPSQIDFMRGPAEQARAISERRLPRLSSAFALHITELALAIQHASTQNGSVRLTSHFAALQPQAHPSR